jgi:hypothetical protein
MQRRTYVTDIRVALCLLRTKLLVYIHKYAEMEQCVRTVSHDVSILESPVHRVTVFCSSYTLRDGEAVFKMSAFALIYRRKNGRNRSHRNKMFLISAMVRDDAWKHSCFSWEDVTLFRKGKKTRILVAEPLRMFGSSMRSISQLIYVFVLKSSADAVTEIAIHRNWTLDPLRYVDARKAHMYDVCVYICRMYIRRTHKRM